MKKMLFIGIIIGALIAVVGRWFFMFVLKSGDRKVLKFVVAAGMIFLCIYIFFNTAVIKHMMETFNNLVYVIE